MPKACIPPTLAANAANTRLAEQEKAARAKLAEIAGRKLGDVGHESIVFIGDVVDGILQAVEQLKPELLVMATHGRGALAHFFLGSVAEAMVRNATIGALLPHLEPRRHPGSSIDQTQPADNLVTELTNHFAVVRSRKSQGSFH